MEEHDLIASAWTWAGSAPVHDRIRIAADAGFAGLALSLDDLHEVRATTGFAGLRRVLDDTGIVWVQLGTLDHWWHVGERADDDADRGVVLEAAATLRAWQVVARADTTMPGTTPAAMVDAWDRLAAQADAVGVQLVLEPEPWSNVPTVERASRFVADGHPNAGLLVDTVHALRGGSTLASLRQGVDPTRLAAVELSDGLLHTPAGMTLAEEAREARHLPGVGAWDLVGFVRTMRALGHDGPWGVEVRTPAHRALPLADALRTAAAATRAVLDAADAQGAAPAPAMPSTPAPTSAVDYEHADGRAARPGGVLPLPSGRSGRAALPPVRGTGPVTPA